MAKTVKEFFLHDGRRACRLVDGRYVLQTGTFTFSLCLCERDENGMHLRPTGEDLVGGTMMRTDEEFLNCVKDYDWKFDGKRIVDLAYEDMADAQRVYYEAAKAYLKEILGRYGGRLAAYDLNCEFDITDILNVSYDGGHHPECGSTLDTPWSEVFLNDRGEVCLVLPDDSDEYDISRWSYEDIETVVSTVDAMDEWIREHPQEYETFLKESKKSEQ